MKAGVNSVLAFLVILFFGGCCSIMYSSIPPYGGSPIQFKINRIVLISPQISEENDKFIQGVAMTLNKKESFFCGWCGNDSLPVFEFRRINNVEYDTIQNYHIASSWRIPIDLLKMKNPPRLSENEYYMEMNNVYYKKDSIFNCEYAVWNHNRDTILRVGHLGPVYSSDVSMMQRVADYMLIQFNLLD